MDALNSNGLEWRLISFFISLHSKMVFFPRSLQFAFVRLARGVSFGPSKHPQDGKISPEEKFYFDWLLYFQSAMVPYFYIGGQIIWAKQYNVVWKQLAFMGTILFFPYPFSLKNCENQANFFSELCNFPRLMEKTAWVEFFFNFCLWGKRVGCINQHIYLSKHSYIVFRVLVEKSILHDGLCLLVQFFKFPTPSPILINQAYSGTKQVIERSYSLGNSILSFVHTFANVSGFHLCRHP